MTPTPAESRANQQSSGTFQDTIQVIMADVSHLPTLGNLLNQARLGLQQSSNQPACEHFLFERLINHENVIFLAQAEPSGQGIGLLQLYPSFSSESLRPVWILGALYVFPEFRRQGVARQLLQEAIQMVVARGDENIQLTLPANAPEAQAWCKAVGFHAETQNTLFRHSCL